MNFSQPTPEIPVPNVQEAQEYDRDRLGFKTAWHNEDGKIGAVASGSIRESNMSCLNCPSSG